MSPGKQLPPPSSGGADLTALLRSRHVPSDAAAAPSPAPAPRKAPHGPSEAAQRPGKGPAAVMDRRSWYMPKEAADALAQAVEELHYATRRPKHVVMAAVVQVALAHLDEVQRRVEEGQ
ncbi:hypothetical protein [Streptomyces sp. NPDC001380]|uniref:hypothetical protein n=1 Tax=Streptomyces sp. NPDC001380 TaxID=3364566 RepID=UPI0036B61AE3